MVNAWSLADSVINGTLDEDYPMFTPEDEKTIKIKDTLPATDDVTGIFEYPDEGGSYSIGDYGPAIQALNDEKFDLNIQANSPYNDGWTKDFYKEELENMSDARNKYHEKEILKDVEDYVSRTYNGHYTGTKHEYRNVQTIDLMASRDLASDFCQANILKYGSRYGSKDGRNKKDLMKVIHYAMLLLHFDEHYGKPSITTGNIDHNMP